MDFTNPEVTNVKPRSKSHSAPDAVAAGAPIGLSTGNAVVDRIGQMHFEGNIIDHRWLSASELRFKNGKLNMAAVLVLADVIYWHRPTIIRDERTNQVIEVRKKFSGAQFYKDYQLWADSLGLTKRQVQDAVAFLVDAGLVEREAKSITLGSGLMSNNLPLITPIPEAIEKLTYGASSTRTPPTQSATATKPDQEKKPAKSKRAGRQRKTPHVSTGHPSRHSEKPIAPQRETSTENTAETSAQIEQTTTARARVPAADVVVLETSFLSAASAPSAAPPVEDDYRVLDSQAVDTSGAADAWEVEALAQRLFEHGIPKKTAARLADASPEMCAKQLEWLPAHLKDQEAKKRAVKNVPGYLRRAIEDGYAKPASLQNSEREQEAAAHRRAAVEAEERQRHTDRERQEKQREIHDAEVLQIQAYYDSLPDLEREAIEEQARRRCAGLAAMGLNATSALEAEKRMILRRELGLDTAAV